MKLGAYAIQRELGRGSMGRVCVAVHEPTGVTRAVKLLEVGKDTDAVARFRREAAALARAAGEGVVSVHEIGLEGRTLWFAMDLMPGGSLKDRLAKRGPYAWRDAVDIVRRLASALGRCHAAGLVHRDVKPENVLFDEQDAPRLGDFGLVRDLGASRLTQTGSLLGTPAYMAPEQFEGKETGPATDVFALGLVLHELVTGERPYRGDTVREVFLAVRARRRSSASAASGAPAALDRALDRALDPDPSRRPPDGAAFARELAVLLAKKEVGVAAAPRRSGVILGACAAFVLVLLSLVLWRRGETAGGGASPSRADGAEGRAPVLAGAGVPAAVSTAPPLARSDAVGATSSERQVQEAARGVALALEHIPADLLGRSREERLDIAWSAAGALQQAMSAGYDVPPKSRVKLMDVVHLGAVTAESGKALPLWSKLLELEPGNALARTEALEFLGRHLWNRQAAELYEPLTTARARDPAASREDRVHGYAEAARVLGQLGRSRDADDMIAEALAKFPGEPELELARAQLLSSRNRGAEALALTDGLAAACAGPLRAAVVEFRAGQDLARGDPGRCLRELGPDTSAEDWSYFFLCAQAHKKLGRLEDARRDIRRAWDYAARGDDDARGAVRRAAAELGFEAEVR